MFLEELFRGKTENTHILIWSLQNKTSRWFSTAADAQEFVKGKTDAYVGVALSPANFGPKRRCEVSQTAGLVSLWADVDILHPVHKKNNLPATYEEARALISTPTPTCIINSGHGLQAWWMFETPWMFDSDTERDEAISLCGQWSNMVRARAKAAGFDADGTGDLARIMRIPGTYNGKTAARPEVKTIEANGKRYTVDALRLVLDRERPEEFAEIVKKKTPVLVTLDVSGNPPAEKMEALLVNDKKFKQSWDRSRKDLQDQSPSSYDLSLATLAAAAGWSDQEITNLLIASRRKHGDDLKREDYYERTITVAKKRKEESEAIAALSDEVQENVDVLSNISRILGIDIIRVVYYVSDPPGFRIETVRGNVMVGENLLSLLNLKQKFVLYAKHMIPSAIKQKDWERIVESLLRVAVDEDLGSESTTSGAFETYLQTYLDSHRPVEEEEGIPDAIKSCTPYLQEKELIIFGPQFRKWLQLSQGEKVTHKELGLMIRGYGGYPDKVNVGKTTRGVWRLPA